MALRWFLCASSMQIVVHPSENEGSGSGGGMEQVLEMVGCREEENKKRSERSRVEKKREHCSGFQMPLHYPRYKKEDYEKMEEWKVDMLLREYGLACEGSVQEKRVYAMGAFLWPDQL